MAGSKNQLREMCTPESKVRETFYSETYRQYFQIGEVAAQWDITHISIPFSEEKEAELCAKFGLKTKEEISQFYEVLSARIYQEQDVLKQLSGAEVDKKIHQNFISYHTRKKTSKDSSNTDAGYDFWFISEPMESIFGSNFIPNKNAISLLELLTLATRMTQTLKVLQECDPGVHIGAFDLDTMYVVKSGNQERIVNGSLLYGDKESAERVLPTLKTSPATLHPSVAEGGRQNLDTDLYAIGAMLWSMASGQHWTTAPNMEEAPKYAPDELVRVLVLCMEGGGEKTLKEAHETFHKLGKAIKRDASIANPMIPIGEPIWMHASATPEPENPPELNEEPVVPAPIPVEEPIQPPPAAVDVEEDDDDDIDGGWDFIDGPMEAVTEVEDTVPPTIPNPVQEEDTPKPKDVKASEADTIPIPIPVPVPEAKEEPASIEKKVPAAPRPMAPMRKTPIKPAGLDKKSGKNTDSGTSKKSASAKGAAATKKKNNTKAKAAIVGVAAAAFLLGLFAWKGTDFLPFGNGSSEPVLDGSEYEVEMGYDDDFYENFYNGDYAGNYYEDPYDDDYEASEEEEDVITTPPQEDPPAEDPQPEPTPATPAPSNNSNTTSSTNNKTNTSSSSSTSKPSSSSSSSSSKPSTSTSKPSSSSSSSSSSSTSSSSTSKPSSSASSSSGSGNNSSTSSSSSNNNSSNNSSTSNESSSSNSSSSSNNSSSGNQSSTTQPPAEQQTPPSTSQPTTPPQTTQPSQPAAFTISKGSASLSVGGTTGISANAPCSWRSSNPGVAYVAGGAIVGVSPGTCTITAVRTSDGATRTLVVTVT